MPEKDIFGLPGLKPEDLNKVKIGTLLAKRAAQLCTEFDKLGLPFVLEQPLSLIHI